MKEKQTIKEKLVKGLKAVGKAIKNNAAKIAKAIADAKVETLLKLGIVSGVAIAAAIVVLKFLNDKRKMYKSLKNKTTVDEAIDVNYADVKKQEKLHPLMKKVKKNLKKDLKPRKDKRYYEREKRSKKTKRVLDDAAIDALDKELYKEYVEFLNNLEFERAHRREIDSIYSQEDPYSLRTLWVTP